MYYCPANLSGVTTAVVTMTAMRDGPGPGIPPPVPALLSSLSRSQTRAELCEAAAANKDPVHWSQCAEGLLNTPITLDNDTMMPSTGHRSLEDTGAGGWPVTSWGSRHNVATVLLSKFRRKLLAFSSIR